MHSRTSSEVILTRHLFLKKMIDRHGCSMISVVHKGSNTQRKDETVSARETLWEVVPSIRLARPVLTLQQGPHFRNTIEFPFNVVFAFIIHGLQMPGACHYHDLYDQCGFFIPYLEPDLRN